MAQDTTVSAKRYRPTSKMNRILMFAVAGSLVAGAVGYVGVQSAYAAKTTAAVAAAQGGKIMTAADPSIIYSNGQYYGTYVSGGSIYVRKAATIAGIASAPAVKVWANTGQSEVWAPEIIKYNGMYHIYFTYGAKAAHRMYVISSATPDSGYGAATKVTLPDDKWAIDGVLFTYNNEAWFTWSGWKGDVNGEQDIYIARMSDPATATGPRYIISKPTETWERKAGGSWGLPYVNEAPQPILDPSGQLHLGYSANGYWSQSYCIADLRLRAGGDPTNILDWFKSNGCLFGSSTVMSGVGTLATKSKGIGHHSYILQDGDISNSPAAGATRQFAYAAVPNTSFFYPDTNRAWYWGNKTWLSNVTYTRASTPTDPTNTAWTPKYFE